MIITIILLYSFIVRGFKRHNKQLEPTEQIPSAALTTSTYSAEVASTSAASLEQSNNNNNNNDKVINSNKGNLSKKNSILKLASLASVDEEEYLHSATPSARRIQYNDDIDDCSQLTDEEDFYNIISTQPTGFHSKRHSSSASSKSSIYGSSILLYDGRRHNSQSSTTSSELMSDSRVDTSNRRLSGGQDDNGRILNRKLNYKTRRHGFQTLSKRRRTTGRY